MRHPSRATRSNGGRNQRAQLAPRDVGLAGVAPALRLGVPGEVLGGREDRGRVVEAVALVAAHHRRARARRSGTGPRRTSRRPGPSAGRGRCTAPARRSSGCRSRRPRPRSPARPARPASASHVAAMPSWVGKIVAPSPERVPVDAVLGDEQRDAQAGLRGELVRLAGPAPARCAGSSRRACAARCRRGRRARRAGASARPSPRGSSAPRRSATRSGRQRRVQVRRVLSSGDATESEVIRSSPRLGS